MNFEKLRKLSELNEVSLFDYNGRTRTPPYYYDSLRHALGFYFNTFITQNISYEYYSNGLDRKHSRSALHNIVDDENTVQAIIFFERFFELYIKDLLKKTHRKFTYSTVKRLNGNKAQSLIDRIRSDTFDPKLFNKKYLSVPFREALDRFYALLVLHKNHHPDRIVKRFGRIIKQNGFLESEDYKAVFYLLSWYRDRILHNGNRIPTLWLLDYIVSQRVIPIIKDITDTEKSKLGDALFYFQTETKIDILDRICSIKYEFKDLRNPQKKQKIFRDLLHLGHLKELGRANLNMNWYVRRNIQATYEYNYKDPKGRAKRFAEAERLHEHFRDIRSCPCCGEKTLVLYRNTIEDVLFNRKLKDIDWVKCYLCDYHIRYNVGDPSVFNLNREVLFDSQR